MELKSFQEKIATTVAGCNETVMDRVVQHYAEKEAERRVPLIMRGLDEEQNVLKELSKIKTTKQYDLEGNITAEFLTAGDQAAKTKHTERLDKVRSALNSALSDANYEPLEKLLKGSQAPAPKDD